MRKVKCGVIGLGWFGEWHLDIIKDLPFAELHSMCTRTETRLKDLGARYGVTNLYTDYREMLKDPELELVSVTTMWDQHVGPALAVLEAGKHLFLEKPMASTVEDCQAIVDASRKAPGKFMVGHICRFNPRYACAKQEIDLGRIGDIVSIYARRNLSAGITDEILNKIGPISGDGVHDTDLMLWFTGQKIETVYAQTTDIRGRKYPDIGWTMYRFANGATGVCENNWAMNGNLPMWLDERMVVHGTEGSISIKDTTPNYNIVDGDGLTYPDTTYWPEYHGLRRGALRDEWQYFTECVVNDTEQNIILAEESMAAVEACLAAEESAATGKIVKLKR